MSKNLGPVCKLCRREGEKLYLKGERCFTPKCAVDRRNFPPVSMGVQAVEARVAVLVASLTIYVSCAPNNAPDVFMGFWSVSSAAIMKLLSSAAA